MILLSKLTLFQTQSNQAIKLIIFVPDKKCNILYFNSFYMHNLVAVFPIFDENDSKWASEPSKSGSIEFQLRLLANQHILNTGII